MTKAKAIGLEHASEIVRGLRDIQTQMDMLRVFVDYFDLTDTSLISIVDFARMCGYVPAQDSEVTEVDWN